jgi:L-fucose mutarotase
VSKERPPSIVKNFATEPVVGAPDYIPDVQQDVKKAIKNAERREHPMQSMDRFAFYDFAKQSYAVIQTGERRFYGCFILRKGVLSPDA